MPGIDYTQVRSLISMATVLKIAGFKPAESSGEELRGPCPIHGSSSPNSRSFAANSRKHTFQCFKCGAKGNQLDLWMAITRLPLHAAARDLCQRAGVEAPEVRRW